MFLVFDFFHITLGSLLLYSVPVAACHFSTVVTLWFSVFGH